MIARRITAQTHFKNILIVGHWSSINLLLCSRKHITLVERDGVISLVVPAESSASCC